MSLMDDAEIWESGSSPDNMPCSSEQGASEQETEEEELNVSTGHFLKQDFNFLIDFF